MSTQPTERPPEWALAAAMELFPHGQPNASYCWGDPDKNIKAQQNYRDHIAAIIAKHAPRETVNAQPEIGEVLDVLEGTLAAYNETPWSQVTCNFAHLSDKTRAVLQKFGRGK